MGRKKKTETVIENESENSEFENHNENENLTTDESSNDFKDTKEKLDDVFRNFEENKSEFSANAENLSAKPLSEVFKNEKAKKAVMRIMNYVFTGLNMVLINMFMKEKISFADLKLTEAEMTELDIYAEDIAAYVLQYLPAWVLGLLHVELIYMSKVEDVLKNRKKEKDENSKN